jgi:hypothetical protein
MALSLDLYQLLIAIVLAIPFAFLFTRFNAQPSIIDESQEPYRKRRPITPQKPVTMQTTRTSAPTEPPKDDKYTHEQLKQYDGTGADGKIYVAVKGASGYSHIK